MNELSRIDADDREERKATQHEKLRQQQRFEAALRFATIQCAEREGFRMDYPTFSEAIELADDLIERLEIPTTTNEDTAF